MTSYSHQFYVPGRPTTKGSWRPIKTRTGRVLMRPNNPQQYDSWVGTVKTYAVTAGVRPQEGPVDVGLVFFLQRPKKWFRANGAIKPNAPAYPATMPDLDKLTRLILDALTGIAWKDDGQVVKLMAGKIWADAGPEGGASRTYGPGVLITLTGATPEEV